MTSQHHAPLVIIAAMSRNRLIGSGDGMPWKVPEEYRQFLATIEGHTVLMGRRSWEIFGRDLTSKHNIVVSRSAGVIEGATVVGTLESALEVARGFGTTVYCAGGGLIYAQTVPLADEMALSYIKGEFEGDTYFPEFDESEWEIVERKEHLRFEFVRYRRPRQA